MKNGSSGTEMPAEDELGYYEGLSRTGPADRESLGRAFVTITVFGAIFAALLFVYYRKVQVDEEVLDLATQAKDELVKNSPAALLEAERLFKQALELDSGEPYVISALALLNAELWAEGQVEARKGPAVEFTRRAEEGDFEKQERFGARALIQVGEGQFEQAEKDLVELVNRGGLGPAIFGALGVAQRSMGKTLDARQSLRRAAESEWRNPRHVLWIARTYFEDGDYRNAQSFAKKGLDANADHPWALVLAARVAIAREEGLVEAKRNIEDVLARGDAALTPFIKSQALIADAEMLRFDRKLKAAAAKADEALAAWPGAYEAYIVKGLALADRKDDAALDALTRGFEMFPFSPRSYHLAARALLGAGKPDEALQVMNTWGEKVAKDAAYHLAFGNLLLEKGDTEAAVTELKKALELDAGTEEAYYRLGTLEIAAAAKARGEERTAHFDAATDYFNKAVEARESYPEVYEAMGWMRLQQGHHEDALRMFVQALTFYKANRAERETMNELRVKVGDALKRSGKRSWYKPWMSESRDLIR